MSEYNFLRSEAKAAIARSWRVGEELARISRALDDHPDSKDAAWEQAFYYQLGKVANGREPALFGPFVQPVPGSELAVEPIFAADDHPRYYGPVSPPSQP